MTRDLVPVVAKLTLKASLDGVTLTLDGTPHDVLRGEQRRGADAMLGCAINRDVQGDALRVRRLVGRRRHHPRHCPRPKQHDVHRAPPFSSRSIRPEAFRRRFTTIEIHGDDRHRKRGEHRFRLRRRQAECSNRADTFFIRWRGKVQPQFSETYTFYADADDAVRLFVDGQLLVDTWDGGSAGVEQSGTIDLVAGQKYDLRFDYYENTGDAMHICFGAAIRRPRP